VLFCLVRYKDNKSWWDKKIKSQKTPSRGSILVPYYLG